MPELLRQGKVFVAETPLFEIVLGGKDGSVFAYTVDEKNQILVDLEKKGKKFKKIHRSKGLGENTPDMLWDTTMNPKTRRLVKLDIDINNEYVRAMSNFTNLRVLGFIVVSHNISGVFSPSPFER